MPIYATSTSKAISIVNEQVVAIVATATTTNAGIWDIYGEARPLGPVLLRIRLPAGSTQVISIPQGWIPPPVIFVDAIGGAEHIAIITVPIQFG